MKGYPEPAGPDQPFFNGPFEYLIDCTLLLISVVILLSLVLCQRSHNMIAAKHQNP